MHVVRYTGIKGCGNVHSGNVVQHDQERVSGLAIMRRPDIAGKLMQVQQALIWMRIFLPRMAEAVNLYRECGETHGCQREVDKNGGDESHYSDQCVDSRKR